MCTGHKDPVLKPSRIVWMEYLLKKKNCQKVIFLCGDFNMDPLNSNKHKERNLWTQCTV